MSASAVQICNLALSKFGDVTISSITSPTNKFETACSIIYPQMRDILTASHPWNFAMERADISASLTTTPAFEWDYAYTVPADSLRVFELWGTDDEWVVESGVLKTNKDSEIYIRYIKQVESTGLFPPAYVDALSIRLAAELAPKFTGSTSKRTALLEELYKVSIPNALKLNAIEGNKPRHKDEQPLDNGNYSWQTQGHSGELLTDKVYTT